MRQIFIWLNLNSQGYYVKLVRIHKSRTCNENNVVEKDI